MTDVNTDWPRYLPLDQGAQFNCAQTLTCWHGTLPTLGKDRLQVMNPALQPGLQALNVYNNQGDAEDSQAAVYSDSFWLAEALSNCHKITTINFEVIDVHPDDLSTFLAGTPCLKSVTLGPHVGRMLQPAALSALADLQNLHTLDIAAPISLTNIQAAADLWQSAYPFAALVSATLEVDDGAGRATALFLSHSHSLEHLHVSFHDIHRSWALDDDQAFDCVRNFRHLESLTLILDNDLVLNGACLFALKHLDKLVSVEIGYLNIFQAVTSRVSITAEDFVDLLSCLKDRVTLHVRMPWSITTKHMEEADQVDFLGTLFDPVFSLRREIHLVVETSAFAGSQLPVADADTMLGINANFVPGGNLVRLSPPVEDETDAENT